MRAGQKRGPDGQTNGRCHTLMRILDEAVPACAQPIIHAAFGELHALYHFCPETSTTQLARKLQSIMKRPTDRPVPTKGFVSATFKQNQLPASSAKLRTFGLRPSATGQIADQQQVDHRHGQCFTQSADDLARHARHHGKLLLRGMAAHGSSGITRQAHIGINEQEMRPPRRFRQPRAGMHLAGPALRQRRAGK